MKYYYPVGVYLSGQPPENPCKRLKDSWPGLDLTEGDSKGKQFHTPSECL